MNLSNERSSLLAFVFLSFFLRSRPRFVREIVATVFVFYCVAVVSSVLRLFGFIITFELTLSSALSGA